MIPLTTYMIFPVTESNKIDFSQVLETSQDTLRRSVDGTLTFVNWYGTGANIPSCLNEIVGSQGTYSYEEILLILAEPTWTAEFRKA